MAHVVKVAAGLSARGILSMQRHFPGKLRFQYPGYASPTLPFSCNKFPGKLSLTVHRPFRVSVRCTNLDPLPWSDVVLISSRECSDGSIIFKFDDSEQHHSGIEAITIKEENGSVSESQKTESTEKEDVLLKDELFKGETELQGGSNAAPSQPIKEEGNSHNSLLDECQREEDTFPGKGSRAKGEVFHENVEQLPTLSASSVLGDSSHSQQSLLDLAGLELLNLNEEDTAVGNGSAPSSNTKVQNEGNMTIIGEGVKEGVAVENELKVSEDSKWQSGTEVILRLLSGGSMRPHPKKLATGGEDAYFIEGAYWVGVADGVGGWASEGINAGFFSRELMSNCALLARGGGIPDPKNVLAQSVQRTKAIGTCTAVLAALHGQTLYVANVGDTGFVVVRDGVVLHRSIPMQRAFNFPYQVGSDGDDPSIANTYEVAVGKGDVLVLGTDGLYDNLYENEIVGIIQSALKTGAKPEDAAMWLVKSAHTAGASTEGKSPFSDAARAVGYSYSGGKQDDVTVVVSYVQ